MIESRERANLELRCEGAGEAAEAGQAKSGEHSAFSKQRPVLYHIWNQSNV